MLIDCPECGQSVSDRARACPRCAFPVAEATAEQAAAKLAEVDRGSRRRAGTTDCPNCSARGFVTDKFINDRGEEREGFTWCWICDHSGRIGLVQSDRGYWAVGDAQVTEFVDGGIGEDHEAVWFLGADQPTARFPERPSSKDEPSTE